jgi:hypothetical protein
MFVNDSYFIEFDKDTIINVAGIISIYLSGDVKLELHAVLTDSLQPYSVLARSDFGESSRLKFRENFNVFKQKLLALNTIHSETNTSTNDFVFINDIGILNKNLIGHIGLVRASSITAGVFYSIEIRDMSHKIIGRIGPDVEDKIADLYMTIIETFNMSALLLEKEKPNE